MKATEPPIGLRTGEKHALFEALFVLLLM